MILLRPAVTRDYFLTHYTATSVALIRSN